MVRIFLLLLSSLWPALFVYTNLHGQQSTEFLNLCETSDEISKAASSQGEFPLAVPLSTKDLKGVSSSILIAETWLRSNVLLHYPAAKITNIVAETSAFCQLHKNNLTLVHSSLKNLYHSLKGWGMEHEIKVSVAFHLHCSSPDSPYKDDLKMLGPLMWFLKNAATIEPNEKKIAMARKILASPFPIRPTPMPKIAEPPFDFHFPVCYPTSSPLAQGVSSPPLMSSSTFAPQEQPSLPSFVVPASSPHGFTLPPCNPIDNGSPYPQIIPIQKQWCVARPTVPEETLQQALVYACGESGADCMEMTPQGNCYYPDIVVAHASYAINSYWQKHKRNGGT